MQQGGDCWKRLSDASQPERTEKTRLMPTNTIRIHRVLRAAPEKIYRAFLDPDAMAKWLQERDEVRMLSVECRTHQRSLPRAVFRDATVIATSWFASPTRRANSVDVPASIGRCRSSAMSQSISSQNPDSSASSSTIPSFAIKSAFDFPRHADR